MIFNTLCESAERGELLLVDGGFCNWHLRNDGQLTIREIISTRKGAGYQMLNRLEHTVGATSLFAKCPVHLESNSWYTRQNFHVERMEFLPSGAKVLHWRKWLKAKSRPNVNGVEIVFSSGGNADLTNIAIDEGMLAGSRLPCYIYHKPYFVDQEYADPNLVKYEQEVAKVKPYMATVLDWQHHVSWNTVLQWSEAIAPHVQELIVIPKIPGTISQIPETLYGKPVRLGYSIPTAIGGTPNSIGEFTDRPVHLLGGSPEKQMELAHLLNVVSTDTNYMQRMATEMCAFWTPNSPYKSRNNYFVTLKESDGGWQGKDAHHEAFRRSCHNIMQAWRNWRKEPKTIGMQMALAI